MVASGSGWAGGGQGRVVAQSEVNIAVNDTPAGLIN